MHAANQRRQRSDVADFGDAGERSRYQTIRQSKGDIASIFRHDGSLTSSIFRMILQIVLHQRGIVQAFDGGRKPSPVRFFNPQKRRAATGQFRPRPAAGRFKMVFEGRIDGMLRDQRLLPPQIRTHYHRVYISGRCEDHYVVRTIGLEHGAVQQNEK